jgi:alpha-tubulin suppressor-like RCC1 family protein
MRPWLSLAVALPVTSLLATPGCALTDDDFDGDGWSAVDGDCDDLDAGVHPSADEIDRDGIDQDCDRHDRVMEAAGAEHACDLDDVGRVACTGDDSRGQLAVPTGRFVAIVAGDFHTCALGTDGRVACWGDDTWGQASPPDGVFVSIAAGHRWSSGVRPDETELCWGLCPMQL